MREDFAIFMLTYQRADNILTIDTLEKGGYTGKWYLVVGDDDKQMDEYQRRYPGKVVTFHKQDVAVDKTDNFGNLVGPVFARNALIDIAKGMGLKYYWMLEDDYTNFYYRRSPEGKFVTKKVQTLDAIIDYTLEYMEATKAATICFAQGGDFIGGKEPSFWKILRPHRKAMNSYFLSTERPLRFPGNINEDVNAYILHGSRGDLFFTLPNIMLIQPATQAAAGGMTDIYKKYGTYYKSFTSVMLCPSFVIVKDMGRTNRRIHHCVDYKHGVPRIIRENWKKV